MKKASKKGMNKETEKTKEEREEFEINSQDANGVTDKEEIAEEMSEKNTENGCQDEKAELFYRLSELNDKFLRLHSEFDNYRKRTIKEKNELSKFANAELITELLPVIDDFERAIKSIQKSPETEPIVQGIELIYQKLARILELQGLKPIKSVGESFNTDFHEAVTKVSVDDDTLKGKVYDEIQKGYELHEKIIRYAKVVVAE